MDTHAFDQMTQRLSDRTAELADRQLRQSLIAAACLKHQHGMLAMDISLMDETLALRRVNGPMRMHIKAAIAAGSTSDATWAGPLSAARPMLDAYIREVDRQWVLPQIGAPKVPSANAVGAAQTVSATSYWIGETIAKPIAALGFAALALPSRKVVGQVAVTDETVRFAHVDALAWVDAAVSNANAVGANTALLDPANAGIANVKPASLTNGLVAITPAGDFQNQVGQVLAALSGGEPARPVLVVSLQTALRLTGLRDLREIGVRVIVTSAAGNRIIGIDADGVVYSDDGGDVRVGQPDLQMDDTPTSPSTAATVMVNAWSRNLSVVRGERWVNWAKRADAVAYLTLA